MPGVATEPDTDWSLTIIRPAVPSIVAATKFHDWFLRIW